MPSRALTRIVALALLVVAPLLLWANKADASTSYVSPGQQWSEVLSRAAPGDTVVIRNGTYGRQTITQRFAGTVRVVGESTTGVVVQGLNVTSGASNLTFSGMTITTASSSDGQSAVKIYGASHHVRLQQVVISPRSHAGVEVQNWGGAPHDIAVTDSTITGRNSSATTTGRNIWIGDLNGGDYSTWPANVEVLRNDLGHASADAIHISGGTSVTISGNEIHDVRDTSDHNDGIQSVASKGLRIVGNRITSPGTWTCSTCVPPDQAIIVGDAYPATANKKVVGTFIADNIVHHWRGKGVMVTGTVDTRVVNNTVTRLGLSGTTTAAALTVAEPYGYTNRELRIWNNVVDRLATNVTVPIAYIGHNCIREGGVGESTVSADPRFSDTTREFTLAADSPCRTVGWANWSWETPTVDFAGVPMASPPDAGARQHTGSSTTTTTTAPATTTTQPPSWEPTTTTTTTAPATQPPVAVTEAFSGSVGGRGGTRAHSFSTGSGMLSGSVELAREASVTVELFAADGTSCFWAVLGNGQSFWVTMPAGNARLEVSSAGQARYTITLSHPA